MCTVSTIVPIPSCSARRRLSRRTILPFRPLGAGILWDQLERAGIPEVKGVWGYVYSAQPGPFTVISIKQAYAGHAKQTLLVAAGT